MKVLIGSQALIFHLKSLDRVPSDYDFIHSEKIDGAEVFDFEEKSNRLIYEYCNNQQNPIIDSSPYGETIVAPLVILKAIKLGSLAIAKQKHQFDLNHYLKDVIIPEELNNIISMRKAETEERVKSQKLTKFFVSSNFPRIMDHDKIHSYISDRPMYKKILKEGSLYKGDEQKFNLLSFEEKKLLIFEEIMVFGIERNLLPRIEKMPSLIMNFVDVFKQCSKSSDIPLAWFFKFSAIKGVKGTPIWQSQWIQDNEVQLLKDLPLYWSNKIDELSTDFWDDVIEKTFKNSN